MMDIPDGPGGRCDPDGVLEEGELCDGSELGTASCSDFGYSGGTLVCRANCTLDTSGCGGSCGDGVLDPAFEGCEGDYLAGLTCRDDGKFFGTPACGAACGLDSTFCRDTELWGTPGLEIGTALTVTDDGSLFVTGPTNGTMDGQSPSGGTDLYLTKFGPGGLRQWSRQWGTPLIDRGVALTMDAGGDMFLTGYTESTLNGQPSTGLYDNFLLYVAGL